VLRAPRILHRDRFWSSAEVSAAAASWGARLQDAHGASVSPIAVVAPLSAEGACLVLAASTMSVAVVLLALDPATWPDASHVAPHAPLALPPSLHHLAPQAERLGYRAVLLPADPASGRQAASTDLFRAPGFAVFTSGSTGSPRMVYRPTAKLIAGARARTDALHMSTGDGVISPVPLSSGQGLVQLITATMLDASLGLLEGRNHRAALSMLRAPGFAYWNATPHLADALGRCTLDGPAAAPRYCVLAAPISEAVFVAFRNRFGVPLRQTYSSTETGTITVDDRPVEDVWPGTVGRPVPGVDIHIGDHPQSQDATGDVGRIWIRSRWQMAGYGLPPRLERPGEVDGWWPTTDVGAIDRAGLLTLRGRLDDCIRTRDSRLVNLSEVSKALRAVSGVRMALAVPMATPTGTSFGAVVECETGETEESVRARLTASLPEWGRPRRMLIVQEWPLLPNGKTDRLACAALLDAAALT
jgi:long-chain acyl-CoA synthetase